MRGIVLNRLLTGTAIAIVQLAALLGNPETGRAENPGQDLKAIEALVPLPDAADVPPPTMAEIGRVPMPDAPGIAIVEPASPGATPEHPAAANASPSGGEPANAPAAPGQTPPTAT